MSVAGGRFRLALVGKRMRTTKRSGHDKRRPAGVSAPTERVVWILVDIEQISKAGPLGAVAGKPQRVGSFRLRFADERWEWSDEVAGLFGYRPGSIAPTTELVLRHKHPDDRVEVARGIAHAIATGEPFSSRHRIIDCVGNVHHVIVVGDRMVDKSGVAIGTAGYYVDVTGPFEEQRQEALSETIPEWVESRATIDQVKGMLMLVYGVSADQAFQVLRWRSQETNIKLKEFSVRLAAAVVGMDGGPTKLRTRFDHLLLTLRR